MNINLDGWAVVTSAVSKYLGCLDMNAEWGNGEARRAVLDHVAAGKPLALSPCFEFGVFTGTDPATGRTGRQAAVVPVDLVIEGVPVYVQATSLYLCSELKDEDRKTYISLVTQGLEIMQRARANAAGLVVPPKGAVLRT